MKMKPKKEKQNYIAGLSLGVMGLGFAATLPFHNGALGLRLLQGGFEAGLVGGLADWFAVTALFRHPLGIPIPHTALLPKNRDKITEAVIAMIETELLRKESIGEKIKSIQIAKLALGKVKQGTESGEYTPMMTSAIAAVIQHVPISEFTDLIVREIEKAADGLDEQAVLHRVLDEIFARGYDEKALDLVLDRTQEWAVLTSTRDMLGKVGIAQIQQLKLNGLMQFALNAFLGYLSEDKLGDMIQGFILRNVARFKDPDDINRNKLLMSMHSQMREALDKPQLQLEIKSWKYQLLNRIDLHAKVEGYLAKLQGRLLEYVRADEFEEEKLKPFVLDLIQRLENQPERIEQGENWIQHQAVLLIEKHYSKIGVLVRENLNKLDNAELVAFIEGKVGRDLQWIRINGAICGFLVGVILTGIRALV
ncbi:uncharacterized membrane-anchored protein YjiN (DUF445 family) [Paenibacillus shirakamiensis]|uniref:Uncharacterized membrane-anchored protein YjiN (DUF445 family) n=1 Tax=Paenibacillus shirakamiensis TaxID=1265935 RepID=A0ABS4JF76_9BACL|nr:DUF445 domain-containing protein [Paenibacillus shirakamiensis]MBP2000367.1 uncharacterized membrane-anchored protein YjiN (DUF445 family) [Paenibacillus shirakamiensis]